jgi:hypothetical protein
VPPVRPDNDECCASGCDPCIFDLYDDAVLRYQAELRAWEERHRHRDGARGWFQAQEDTPFAILVHAPG